MGDQTRFDLPQSRLPKAWYNLNADMPVPMVPPLHPETKEPVTPEFLSVLSPMALLGQDVSPDGVFAVLDIPSDSRDVMRLLGEASPDKWGRLHSLQLEESTGEQPQLKAEVRPGSAALSGRWHCATPTRPDRTGTPATTAPTTPTAPPRW